MNMDAFRKINRAFYARISGVLTEAVWQRCYVHFLRNAWDHLPKKHVDPDCMVELCRIYDRRTLTEARNDLRLWLANWSDKYPSLCEWVEAGRKFAVFTVSSTILLLSLKIRYIKTS